MSPALIVDISHKSSSNMNGSKMTKSPLQLDRERVTCLLLINTQLIKRAISMYNTILINQQALAQLTGQDRQRFIEMYQNVTKRIHCNLQVLTYLHEKYHSDQPPASKHTFPLIIAAPPEMSELNQLYNKLQDLYPEAVQMIKMKMQQMKEGRGSGVGPAGMSNPNMSNSNMSNPNVSNSNMNSNMGMSNNMNMNMSGGMMSQPNNSSSSVSNPMMMNSPMNNSPMTNSPMNNSPMMGNMAPRNFQNNYKNMNLMQQQQQGSAISPQQVFGGETNMMDFLN